MASTSRSGAEPAGARALLDASLSRARCVGDLAVAEFRLAAVSGLHMVLFVLLAAGALMIGWALLVVCGLRLVALLDLPWVWAALALAVVHALLASHLWHTAVKLSNDLTLPQLRKSLTQSTEGQGEWNARRTAFRADPATGTSAGHP